MERFSPQSQFSAGGFKTTAVAADFNGDGKLDLAIAEYGYLSILIGNGDGTFSRHAMANNSSGSVQAISMAMASSISPWPSSITANPPRVYTFF